MQLTKTPDSEETSQRIVDVLAAATDSDPLSMNPTLYDVIDPDALDRLLDTDQQVEVRFAYGSHTVVVDSDGTVSVDGDVFEPDGERRDVERR